MGKNKKEDLGIKIVSQEEKIWLDELAKAEDANRRMIVAIALNEACITTAKYNLEKIKSASL